MTYSSRTLAVWLTQRDPVAVAEVWSLLAAGLRFLARYHHHGAVYGSLSPSMLNYANAKWQVLTIEFAPPEPEYTAPEQLQGHGCLGSDLYSLGLMALQLLTGKPPFSFLPLTLEQLTTEPFTNLYLTEALPVPDPDQGMNHRSLREFLQKLIHPEPAQRFPDALTAHRHLPKSEQYNYPLVDLETLPHPIAPQTANNLRDPLTQNASQNATGWYNWQMVSELWGHDGYVPQINAVSFWGSEHLISASDDRTLKIWHWSSGICEQTLQVHTSFVKALAVAPNHSFFASGGADGSLVLHAVGTNQTIIQPPLAIAAHSQTITAIAITPDSQKIITASADKSICIWSADGKLLDRFANAHDLGILSLTISADGKCVATGSSDRTVKVWQLVAGDVVHLELVHQIRHHTWGVSAVAFSPKSHDADCNSTGSQWLASGGQDNMIYVWSMAQIQKRRPNAQILKTTIKGHSWTVSSLVFASDRQLWSGSWDKTIKCWDITNATTEGQNLHILRGHTDSVSALAWHPQQGNHTPCLSSASYDATVKVWRCTAPQ
ncbi:MAG: hypothetical protein ACK5QS_02975 [Pseudanabaenaceae cyanobacterium]|jgi:WD40 repeat protein